MPGSHPASDAAILSVLAQLEARCGDELSAFEVVSGTALDAACTLASAPVRPFGAGPTPPHAVLIELEGAAGARSRIVDALAGLSDAGLLGDAVVVPAEAAWSLRHGITEGLSHLGSVMGFDVSVPRPMLPQLVAEVRAATAVQLPRALVADFGHWGDGGVHCNLVFPDVDGVAEPPDDRERALARDLVLGAGRGPLRWQLQRRARHRPRQRGLVAPGHVGGDQSSAALAVAHRWTRWGSSATRGCRTGSPERYREP